MTEEEELQGYIEIERRKWKAGPFCTVYPGDSVMISKAKSAMLADKILKGKNKPMVLTLDEWTDKHAKSLRDNLKANLHAMTEMSDEDQASLLRLHLIMVRQWAQEQGLE